MADEEFEQREGESSSDRDKRFLAERYGIAPQRRVLGAEAVFDTSVAGGSDADFARAYPAAATTAPAQADEAEAPEEAEEEAPVEAEVEAEPETETETEPEVEEEAPEAEPKVAEEPEAVELEEAAPEVELEEEKPRVKRQYNKKADKK